MKLLAVALFSLAAQAAPEPSGVFYSYVIERSTSQPVRITVSREHFTRDGCNHFGFSGSFRRIEPAGEGISLVQDFLADHRVAQTLMACPDLPKPRRIFLETEEFEIRPIAGVIYARIFVPQGFRLNLR